MAAGSSLAANEAEKDKLPERIVLWDETEVVEKQVNQVGTSACGATAVLNVLVRLQKSKKSFFSAINDASPMKKDYSTVFFLSEEQCFAT